MAITGWANASGEQVTLTVEVDFSEAITDIGPGAVSTTRTLWDASTWGTSNWDSYAPVYTDVTQWVRSVETNRNYSRDTNKYNTASASIVLDNTDGRFSPLNTSSPYRVGASTGIGPMRPARISVGIAGADPFFHPPWVLFLGYVQAWNEMYPDSGSDATVEVQLVGAEGRIGNCVRNARTASGAGELAGSRVTRILDSVGWQNGVLNSGGDYPLQATTLEGNAMDELQLVADSTAGAVWFDEQANCIYADRMTLINNAFPWSTFVGGLSTGSTLTEFPYSDIAFGYDAELVKNVISYTNVGGTAQTVTAEPSRAIYGDRTQSRTDLIASNDDAANKAATKDIITYRNPELRVESVSLHPRAWVSNEGDPTTGVRGSGWTAMFNLISLRTGAYVVFDRRAGGEVPNTYQRQVVISGIRYSITPDDWRVDVEFQSGSVIGAFFVWDAGFWDNYLWTW